MSYNINYGDLRYIHQKSLCGTMGWKDKLDSLSTELASLINDGDFTGEGADAVKTYLNDVHILIITAIKEIIIEYNSRLALYMNGLYDYDESYYANLNEDYLTLLKAEIDRMVEYADEVHKNVRYQLDGISGLTGCGLDRLEGYTMHMEMEGNNVVRLRNRVGEYDTSYASEGMGELRELIQNVYDLVKKVHDAGTIQISEVDYGYYFGQDRRQEIINGITASKKYIADNREAINAAQDNLLRIQNEVRNEEIKAAKRARMEHGFVLLGACVLGIISVSPAFVQGVPVVVKALAGLLATDSVAKGVEGGQEIYYGAVGDVETASINFVRDGTLKGEQETYDVTVMLMWGVYGTTGSLCRLISAGSGTAEFMTVAGQEFVQAGEIAAISNADLYLS
ncbi:MAG: hypothetical protein J5962_03540, partial [Lachnospiraceae bacterium]|nr:hypothetical protein [Lachnospiraceae bacterium]